MRSHRNLLLGCVLFILSSIVSADVLYQIVEGTLSDSGTFNFSIYSNRTIGVIMQSVDSEGRQFGMKLIEQTLNERSIILNFNKVQVAVSLRQFCGCSPCLRTRLQFIVKYEKVIIHAGCNNQKSTKVTSDSNGNGSENMVYPIPSAIKNRGRNMYIMIGNIGPYDYNGDKTNVPLKDQIVMCLVEFYYKNKLISFIGEDSKIQSSCPRKCDTNICNNGVCTEVIYIGPTCDCRETALSGVYCDRSLKKYDKGSQYSYEKVTGIKEMYFKMAWKTLYVRQYCLINMVLRNGSLTISLKGNHIMVGSSLLADYNVDRINFVSVNLTKTNVVFKSDKKTIRKRVFLKDLTRINVGFVEDKMDCELFDGAFDFDFNVTQLRPVPFQTTNIMKTTVTELGPINTTSKGPNGPGITMIYGGLIMLLFVLLLSLTNIIISIRKKIKIKTDNIYGGSGMSAIDDTYTYIRVNPEVNEGPYSNEDIDGYILPKCFVQKDIPPHLPLR